MLVSTALSLLTIIMLAVVGGVVLWLHLRLDALQANSRKLPILAEKMTKTLVQTQQAVAKLKKDLQRIQPEADGLLIEARNTKQDLVYMLDKTEKVLTKLEKDLAKADTAQKNDFVQPSLPKGVEGVIVEEKEVPKPSLPKKPVPSTSFKEGVAPKVRTESQAETALRSKLGSLR
ncbi:MAG: hypothetical protein OXR68_01700 [Alphaproteobacteria bacterium]|nr:hypothetical protein [Alphaproteobacteria bacterium]MDD9919326.1 hypothetical protein [Alphaproteobacteria bacterium]